MHKILANTMPFHVILVWTRSWDQSPGGAKWWLTSSVYFNYTVVDLHHKVPGSWVGRVRDSESSRHPGKLGIALLLSKSRNWVLKKQWNLLNIAHLQYGKASHPARAAWLQSYTVSNFLFCFEPLGVKLAGKWPVTTQWWGTMERSLGWVTEWALASV